ncbi:MAG: hypothetical protein LC798_13250 [Chloroflexi bacterium]|nr:hypothetical protein [Chloroflexota bacterium]
MEASSTGLVPAVEPEVLWARRAFPMAQELLVGVAHRMVSSSLETGWHDTRAHPERGAFAVVQRGSEYEELLGEVLIVTYGERTPVYVYCANTADVPRPLSLYRRAYLGLTRLSREPIDCIVEVRA